LHIKYIKFDEDHKRRVGNRNQARQNHRGIGWRPQFQTPKTSIMLKIPLCSSIKTTGQSQGAVSLQEEEEEDLRKFRIMIQEIRTLLQISWRGSQYRSLPGN
jgi:hypothetical protein